MWTGSHWQCKNMVLEADSLGEETQATLGRWQREQEVEDHDKTLQEPNKNQWFFNWLDSRQREEPKMTGASNLDHRKKGPINKRQESQGKEERNWWGKLWIYSAEVTMGQPQKACSIVSPMCPIQKCGPEMQKNICSWRCRCTLRQ